MVKVFKVIKMVIKMVIMMPIMVLEVNLVVLVVSKVVLVQLEVKGVDLLDLAGVMDLVMLVRTVTIEIVKITNQNGRKGPGTNRKVLIH